MGHCRRAGVAEAALPVACACAKRSAALRAAAPQSLRGLLRGSLGVACSAAWRVAWRLVRVVRLRPQTRRTAVGRIWGDFGLMHRCCSAAWAYRGWRGWGSLVVADGTAEVCDGEAGVDLERCVEVGDGVSVLFADSKRGTALPTTDRPRRVITRRVTTPHPSEQ